MYVVIVMAKLHTFMGLIINHVPTLMFNSLQCQEPQVKTCIEAIDCIHTNSYVQLFSQENHI